MSTDLQQNHLLNGIRAPGINDVLCGRGKSAMNHSGNQYFHYLVAKHKDVYIVSPKRHKDSFAKLILDKISSCNPPGRFLKYDCTADLWYEIGHKKALRKTRQALREGAPALMHKLHQTDDTKSQSCVQPFPRKSYKDKSLLLLSEAIDARRTAEKHEKTKEAYFTAQSNSGAIPLLVNGDKQKKTKENTNNDGRNSSSIGPGIANNNAEESSVHDMKNPTNEHQAEIMPVTGLAEQVNHQAGTGPFEFNPSKLEDMMNSGIPIISILESDDVGIALSKVKHLKKIALLKFEQGKWEESHYILENIYEFERKMHFCRRKSCRLNDLADTLVHLGIVREKLGYLDLASEAFYESLTLRPRKPMQNDLGMTSAIHHIAMIQRQRRFVTRADSA